MSPRPRSYLGRAVGAGCLMLLFTSRATAQEAGTTTETTLPGTPEPPEPAIGDVLAAAERAYAELRLEEADTQIRSFFDRLAQEGQGAISLEARVRAHVLAASIARARGDLAASDDALDAALAIDPALRLDPALHPPPLLEALERRRALRPISPPAIPVADGPTRPAVSAVLGPDIVSPPSTDPWPWVGLGVGVAVLVGGAITLSVVLSAPPSSFDVRGTIVP